MNRENAIKQKLVYLVAALNGRIKYQRELEAICKLMGNEHLESLWRAKASVNEIVKRELSQIIAAEDQQEISKRKKERIRYFINSNSMKLILVFLLFGVACESPRDKMFLAASKKFDEFSRKADSINAIPRTGDISADFNLYEQQLAMVDSMFRYEKIMFQNH